MVRPGEQGFNSGRVRQVLPWAQLSAGGVSRGDTQSGSAQHRRHASKGQQSSFLRAWWPRSGKKVLKIHVQFQAQGRLGRG
jgi:hypothetical protein